MNVTEFLNDLLAANVPKAAAFALAKLKSLEPSRWKGNRVGEKEHFRNIGFSCGVNLATPAQAWMEFVYIDPREGSGNPHRLFCTCPLEAIGKRGGADVIQLDGVDFEDDDFVMSGRAGYGPLTNEDGSESGKSGFYERIILEFKGTLGGQALRLRFDGDI